MTRKSITTSHAAVPATSAAARCCAASTPTSSSPAARAAWCASCAPRARANEGWIREGADDSLSARRKARAAALAARAPAPAPRGGPRRTPYEAAAEGGRGAADAEPPGLRRRQPAYDETFDPASRPFGEAAAAGAGPAPTPGGLGAARRAGLRAPREPRHVRAVPTNAELKWPGALDVFNASEHPRTVAGVAPLARRAGRDRRCRPPRGQRRVDRRRLGAVLVPLRGRPGRRGRRRARHRAGLRALRARARASRCPTPPPTTAARSRLPGERAPH